jgi:hypothetical protein
MLKTSNVTASIEYMQKAQITFANILGEFDRKTKEVETIIRRVENFIKEAHH